MTFSELSINKPNGETIEMKDLQGKVVLVVNTATKCGLAPQFEGLENLHQKYKDQGLVILGTPCNQFLGQEPETNNSVVEACKINHGVTFQLTEKIDVNGKNTHPLFKFLKNKQGGFLGSTIKWNFTKFLVNGNGVPVKRYSPTTKPEDIEKDILKMIGAK
jgi:glutathione peroxidase|tara:strand:+ start:12850 stop:13332 length:483 start_codon:yes stop_codon:yes gene_type:complete